MPTPHKSERGSDIDVWIKRHREKYRDADGSRTGAWYAIDSLLDDYREHADYGTPLGEDIQGPHREVY